MFRSAFALVSIALLGSCSRSAAAYEDPLHAPRGLESASPVVPADNQPSVAKVELGKQLFFDPRLSASGKTSCSSCHLPEKAFTDGLATSTKDDGKKNTRNSPTMHNVGYLDRLYWDGRAKSLEANVLAAWQKQLCADSKLVAGKIAEVKGYEGAFREAFGGPASEDTITKALASFLRCLYSADSAYDRFVAGDKAALNDAQQKGLELFTGKAGCVTCHTVPLFTDRQFHNIGVGSGAATPDVGAAAKNAFDDPAKTGAFKTPSLRDVAKTAPYFHDGSVATLAEAVKFMAGGGTENPHRDPQLVDRKLTDAEQAQLVAFLESLTGNTKFTAPVLPK